MNLAIISFTKAGSILNNKVACLLQKEYNCTSYYKGRCEENLAISEVKCSLTEWCKEIFTSVEGIIFIGASGIAVRTIAPFIQDKMMDPLVLVIDETAKFVISLLSGHIGGGNALTLTISELLHATPVITTATDLNNKFAVDVFASKEELYIADKKMAKEISACILEGKEIGLVSKLPITGTIPKELVISNENIDIGICISCNEEEKPFTKTLNLVPRMITVGIGCKKNTDIIQFEEYVWSILKKNHISMHSVKTIVSIDLKAKEPCILAFADKYKIEFITYTAKDLEKVVGEFEESEFVKNITGIGNVCERSALIGCEKGSILLKKQAHDGITIALAKEMRGICFE